jgi:hypothetical protein
LERGAVGCLTFERVENNAEAAMDELVKEGWPLFVVSVDFRDWRVATS